MVTTLQLRQEVSDWRTPNQNKRGFQSFKEGMTSPRSYNTITTQLTEDEDEERKAVERARLRLNADAHFGPTIVLARHSRPSTCTAAHRTATRRCGESNVYCTSIIITSANITVDRIKTKASTKNNNNKQS